ncbi:MFS transporter [Taklimakanibacter deserti]|uniref:MFS transporter n=1 Tax=Taklimakanibacter deserti TaxID=2267839 RepID=UPI0013C42286
MRRFPLSQNVLTIAAAITGSSAVMLGESVVSLALPSIGKTLNVPFASLQWVADGYNLTLASCILFGGSLGDVLGLRRVYLWSACAFLALSLLCALAWSGLTLILFRAVLGIAGALLTPVSLAVLNAQLPKDLRTRAVAYWTAATSIVLALGPLVGGYLVDVFSWRAIFLFNVPLALIALALGYSALKDAPMRKDLRIDWAGAILAFLFLAGITFGLIEGPANDWPVLAIAAIAGGVVCFFAFIWWERRASRPLVDFALFRNRNFSATNAATLLLYAAFGGFGFLFSYFLQTVSGFSATAAGAAFLPVSAMLGVASGQVGSYAARFGPRWFMGLGPFFCAAGMVMLLPLGPQTTYLTGVLPGIVLFGIGLTLTVAPLTATALNSAPDEKSGIASAINNGLASAGPLIAIALLGLGGLEHAYLLGVWICVVLAVLAGLVSLTFVRKASA